MSTRLYHLQPQLPTAELTHEFDWTAFMALLPDTDAIATGNVAVTADAGITVSAHTLEGHKVYVKISGGTAGTTYRVTCTVTTDEGQTDAMVAEIAIANAS